MSTTNPKRPVLFAILFTGLLAGLLDGLAAIIQYTLNGGKNPASVFKYIASGIFGREAFSKGDSMVIWGVLFHLLIALLFTAFYFLIYPRIKWLGENKVLAGILYGIFVWAVMTQLVVPVSEIRQPAFDLKKAVIA